MAAFDPFLPLARLLRFAALADCQGVSNIHEMRAELRELVTIEGDLLEEVRERDGAFCVWLRAMIGPEGSEGEESFDFAACSPAWLENELQREPVISGRVLLIAAEFHPQKIEDYVRKRVAQASGSNWSTIATDLGTWSHWEFENYRGPFQAELLSQPDEAGDSVNQLQKARTMERLLFAVLAVTLGAAGYFYERYRTEVPTWELVGLISAGMGLAYVAYRVALNLVLRKLDT